MKADFVGITVEGGETYENVDDCGDGGYLEITTSTDRVGLYFKSDEALISLIDALENLQVQHDKWKQEEE